MIPARFVVQCSLERTATTCNLLVLDEVLQHLDSEVISLHTTLSDAYTQRAITPLFARQMGPRYLPTSIASRSIFCLDPKGIIGQVGVQAGSRSALTRAVIAMPRAAH